MSAAGSTAFSREAIEASLDRIAASRHFLRSVRLVRFLRFTAEALLDGRTDELKERTIGVEVYGRAHDYDLRRDPIVRTEAHRLRARLTAYYEREGAADPIVVGYPKGSYVPELRPGATGPATGLGGCRLVVEGFEDRSPGAGQADLAGAMEEALRARLAEWPGLRVLNRMSGGPAPGGRDPHLAADYRVEGCFERDGRSCRVAVRLVRLADETEIGSEAECFAWSRVRQVAGVLAERLAASIGSTLTRRPGSVRPAEARAFELYVKGRHSVIQYGNTLDRRHLDSAERRLRDAVECDPGFVDALAELAHLELMRLYPPRGAPTDILASARSILERALASDPGHPRSLYLLGHVEGSALRPREALRLTESAVARDPLDPEGRTLLAVAYASLGFWESAVVACDWAVALDPVWDAPRRIKAYLLTRMARLDDTRLAIDEMIQSGTSPTEVAMARFDLRIAEGDLAGARAVLASAESTFSLRPDLGDRREIALGLAEALAGRRRDARRTLHAHRRDGPRFWDHTIRLALALDEQELARDLFLRNPINGSYRWLATPGLVPPPLRHARWRALAVELHERWRRDVDEVGPRLPAPPPSLPGPAELLAPPTLPSRRATA